MKIIKAELLISRKCFLHCSGCAMKRDIFDERSFEDISLWRKGVLNLKELGCEFVAIYGAEPLCRSEIFIESLISMFHELEISYTMITADYQKSDFLNRIGCRSVSVSYDGGVDNRSRMMKTTGAFNFLDSLTASDKACIITILNQKSIDLINMVDEILGRGYWCLFDVAHSGSDSYHGLTKCSTSQVSVPDILGFLNEMIKRKNNGAKIHTSVQWMRYLINNFSNSPRRIWHCKDEDEVGWLTIDYNGDILPCDDFQVVYPDNKIWDSFINWRNFELWRMNTIKMCRGCAWNTHYDACQICKTGEVGTYVH